METVSLGRGYVNDPIRIVGLFYKGSPIEPRSPFQGDDDWLQDLSVQIQNVSAKTLTHVSVQIVFPSLGKPAAFHFASIGQFPEHRRRRKDGTLEPDDARAILIRPGAKFLLPIKPAIAGIKTVLAGRASLSDIHACTIGLNQAFFSDGTMWALQSFFRESADGTNDYVRISGQDFYGVTSEQPRK